MSEQKTQGSTETYCAFDGDEHHTYKTYMRGAALVTVKQCILCGFISFDDLNRQVRECIEQALGVSQ